MSKRLLLVSIVGLLLSASPALASSSKDVVVGKQRGVLLVAGPGGSVSAVRGDARVGDRVVVQRGHVRVVGRATHARVRGVVVRNGRVTFIAAARHLLAIRSANGRRLASVAPNHEPGEVIEVEIEIKDNAELEVEDVDDVGVVQQVEIVGVVTAVGHGTVTVSVGGQTLTIPLRAGVTIPATAVGTQVKIEFKFENGQAVADDDNNADEDDDDHRGRDRGHEQTSTTTTSTSGQTTTRSDDGDGGDRDNRGSGSGDSGGKRGGHG
jgi:hypothetical protein